MFENFSPINRILILLPTEPEKSGFEINALKERNVQKFLSSKVLFRHLKCMRIMFYTFLMPRECTKKLFFFFKS